jgi:hypothetical protein
MSLLFRDGDPLEEADAKKKHHHEYDTRPKMPGVMPLISKVCHSCGTISPVGVGSCPKCGTDLPDPDMDGDNDGGIAEGVVVAALAGARAGRAAYDEAKHPRGRGGKFTFSSGMRVQHRSDGAQGKVSGDMTNGRVPVKFELGHGRDPHHVFMVRPEDLEPLERPTATLGHESLRHSPGGERTTAGDMMSEHVTIGGITGTRADHFHAMRKEGVEHEAAMYAATRAPALSQDEFHAAHIVYDGDLKPVPTHTMLAPGGERESHLTLLDRPRAATKEEKAVASYPQQRDMDEAAKFKPGTKVVLKDGRMGTVVYVPRYNGEKSYAVELEDGERVMATHEDLTYTPEHFEKIRAKIDKATKPVKKTGGATYSGAGGVDHPVTIGTGIPDAWKVERGYAEWVNPAHHNPSEGDEVQFMPGHELHGKTGVVTRGGYYEGQKPGGPIPFRSGSLLFDVKVGGKTHTVTNQVVFGATDKYGRPASAFARTKPGAPDAETMPYEYLVGHPPPPNFAPGTPGYAQWMYGMPKKHGGTGNVKAAEKEAMLRKLAAALQMAEDGDAEGYVLLLAEAVEMREALGEPLDLEEVGFENVAERAGLHAMGSLGALWDPKKHPRGRGGRFSDVLAMLRMNGHHTLPVSGVRIERGRLGGYTIFQEGHQRIHRMDAEGAAKVALEKHDLAVRRLNPPYFQHVRHFDGTMEHRVPRSPGDLPPSLTKVHPAIRSEVGRLLRNVGYDQTGEQVEKTGLLNRDHLSDLMTGEVASTLRSLSTMPVNEPHAEHMNGVASELEQELEHRAARDSAPIWGAPQRAQMKRGPHADSTPSQRKSGRVSKAQALVDSGLASDLEDARAQLADMGEDNSLLSPGGERSPQSDATIGGGGGGMSEWRETRLAQEAYKRAATELYGPNYDVALQRMHEAGETLRALPSAPKIEYAAKKPGGAKSGVENDGKLRVFENKSFGGSKFEVWKGRSFTGKQFSTANMAEHHVLAHTPTTLRAMPGGERAGDYLKVGDRLRAKRDLPRAKKGEMGTLTRWEEYAPGLDSSIATVTTDSGKGQPHWDLDEVADAWEKVPPSNADEDAQRALANRMAWDDAAHSNYGMGAPGGERESWPEFHARVFDNPNAAFRDLKPGDKFSFPHSTDVHTKASGGWYIAPDGRRYRTGAGVLLTRHDVIEPVRDPGEDHEDLFNRGMAAPGGERDLASMLQGLGTGKHEIMYGDVPYTLYYDESPAQGDHGGTVRGDKTGEWEVFHGHGDPLGLKEVTRVHVGPHGSSGYGNAAAPRYAAEQVADAIRKHRGAEVTRQERARHDAPLIRDPGEDMADRWNESQSMLSPGGERSGLVPGARVRHAPSGKTGTVEVPPASDGYTEVKWDDDGERGVTRGGAQAKDLEARTGSDAHYDKVTNMLRMHAGKQVRLTSPNGQTLTGLAGTREYAPGLSEVTLDNMGGHSIFHNAAKVEVKDGARYRTVGEWPEQREAWLAEWEKAMGRTHPSREGAGAVVPPFLGADTGAALVRDPEFRFMPTHALTDMESRLRGYGSPAMAARADRVAREIRAREVESHPMFAGRDGAPSKLNAMATEFSNPETRIDTDQTPSSILFPDGVEVPLVYEGSSPAAVRNALKDLEGQVVRLDHGDTGPGVARYHSGKLEFDPKRPETFWLGNKRIYEYEQHGVVRVQVKKGSRFVTVHEF